MFFLIKSPKNMIIIYVIKSLRQFEKSKTYREHFIFYESGQHVLLKTLLYLTFIQAFSWIIMMNCFSPVKLFWDAVIFRPARLPLHNPDILATALGICAGKFLVINSVFWKIIYTWDCTDIGAKEPYICHKNRRISHAQPYIIHLSFILSIYYIYRKVPVIKINSSAAWVNTFMCAG